MLGEQGYAGLALWLLIMAIGIVRMEMLRRRYAKDAAAPWIAPLAAALQHAMLIYLLGGAFVGIAFQPFLWMLVGAQVALDGWCARHRAATLFRPIGRRQRVALATT